MAAGSRTWPPRERCGCAPCVSDSLAPVYMVDCGAGRQINFVLRYCCSLLVL